MRPSWRCCCLIACLRGIKVPITPPRKPGQPYQPPHHDQQTPQTHFIGHDVLILRPTDKHQHQESKKTLNPNSQYAVWAW
ncbi:hypothetical protein [Eisenibacter elegans]|uniref:hypothetical protein n=1 Tax=Eisenibacter elegans TaxID=997 RepID=UPI0012B535E5|nr:hypothetical protein [Eisenibacter elegans]